MVLDWAGLAVVLLDIVPVTVDIKFPRTTNPLYALLGYRSDQNSCHVLSIANVHC
jgi:hypothetical protein